MISPETPVFRQKINVGNLEYCANIAFTASIIQDISPPEATFLISQNQFLYLPQIKLNFILPIL
jgi:hypothetical protein